MGGSGCPVVLPLLLATRCTGDCTGADFEGRWVAGWMCVCVCGGQSGLSREGGLRGKEVGLSWVVVGSGWQGNPALTSCSVH